MSDSLRGFLLVRVGGRRCALPLAHTIETMRPLPVEPVAGAAGFVRGLSRVRGELLPVVSVAALLGAAEEVECRRHVTVRVGERQIVLAVEAVIGTLQIEEKELAELPPLLRGARPDVVETIGQLDGALLYFLATSRLLDSEDWGAILRATDAAGR